MPWTESRSREEWLAEVQRRGTRIRRRRRVGFGVVGALALVLPVSVTATVLRGGPERAVELSVAGPAPTGGVPDPMTTVPIEAGVGSPGIAASTTEEPPPPAGEPSPTTTTTEVHRRVATINGAVEPAPPGSGPPADKPVVERPTTTLAPLGTGSAAGAAVSDTAVPTTLPPTGPPCAQADLRARVAMGKSVFAAGETVHGTSTLENRGATACVLSFQAIITVQNAAGRSVDSLKVTDFKKAVRVEPGKTFTSSFTWDQKDCASVVVTDVYPIPRERCPQVPAGTYTAIEYSALDTVPASFQIGA